MSSLACLIIISYSGINGSFLADKRLIICKTCRLASAAHCEPRRCHWELGKYDVIIITTFSIVQIREPGLERKSGH